MPEAATPNIFSVSNALKPQRKTSITGLTPATHYIVKVEAYNIAGSSMEEFSFITLTKDGGIHQFQTYLSLMLLINCYFQTFHLQI